MPSITTKRDFSVGEPTDVTVTPKICSAPKRTSNSGFEWSAQPSASLKPLARCKATMVGRNSAYCASIPPNHRFEFLFQKKNGSGSKIGILWIRNYTSSPTNSWMPKSQNFEPRINGRIPYRPVAQTVAGRPGWCSWLRENGHAPFGPD